eukprot:CAMPEP_0115407572 /NCGR_PEP_ID=MMETSP0271-20121206/19036_1 /TAXON_ID=71861 /ORGANISM="Scrippsiella trochoidea, Strain CCMP3099" /LENGTH=207 /DNA_ID=CAMNT_0002831649 /DNA_START=70 /DNA_END=693 /DNA_ORIENTATION=-
MSASRLMPLVAFLVATLPFLALSEVNVVDAASASGMNYGGKVKEEAGEVASASMASTTADAASAVVEAAIAEADAANATTDAAGGSTADETEQATQQPPAAAAFARSSGNLRGSLPQRVDGFAETCCMCSMQGEGSTVLFAAGAYTRSLGTPAANTWCRESCQTKCQKRGALMFGCYGEQQLLVIGASYGQQAGYQILRDESSGGVC